MLKPSPIPEPWSEPVESWLRWLRAAARPDTTVKLRRSQIARVARHFKGCGPWDIGVDDLVLWIGSQDWDSGTIRSHRAALRSFYGWASATDRTRLNPASFLPLARSRRGIPRPAADPIVNAAMLKADRRDALMIRIGFEMGLRCCEIARVHTSDVLPVGSRHVLAVVGKGDKRRVIPMKEDLARLILSYPQGWLFPGRIDGHLSAAYVSKRISWALPKSVTAHMLRHRYGTVTYAEGGANIRAVQKLLGHASIETTQVYTEVSDEALWKAAMAAAS